MSSGLNSWVRKIVSAKSVLEANVCLMPGGVSPCPAGADHHVIARFRASRPAADIAVVEGVAVHQLHGVVTRRGHRRHADDHRLGAQVQPEHGVGRIAVGRNDRRVLPGEHARFVGDLVERRLVLPGIFVHDKLVHRRVIHHDGQAVDKALLGDGAGFLDAGLGDASHLVSLFRCFNRVAIATKSR